MSIETVVIMSTHRDSSGRMFKATGIGLEGIRKLKFGGTNPAIWIDRAADEVVRQGYAPREWFVLFAGEIEPGIEQEAARAYDEAVERMRSGSGITFEVLDPEVILSE
jgi:hypothetical protein